MPRGKSIEFDPNGKITEVAGMGDVAYIQNGQAFDIKKNHLGACDPTGKMVKTARAPKVAPTLPADIEDLIEQV